MKANLESWKSRANNIIGFVQIYHSFKTKKQAGHQFYFILLTFVGKASYFTRCLSRVR